MRFKLFLFIFSLIYLNIANCQTIDIENIKKIFPKDKSIILEKNDSYIIQIKNDTTVILNRIHKEKTLYLFEKNEYIPEDKFYFNSFSKIKRAEAYLYPYTEKRKSKYNVKTIFEKDDYNSNIFFNDSKFLQVLYPSTPYGSITDFEIEEEILEPRLLGKVFFADFYPCINTTLSITFPANVSIDYRLFNCDTNFVNISKSTGTNHNQTWTFTAKNIPSYKYENESFTLNYYEPHIEFFILNYDSNGIKRNISNSINDLHTWYYNITDTIRNEDNALLNAQTDSIISNYNSDFEKAKAIYYWVQENIKYVAFEEGYRGYVPHKASTVFKKKYGDCKDMTSILVNMLSHAGLEAYFTWIGTRSLPYSYNTLPTASVDNHMICALKIDSIWYYLDGTAQNLSISLPSSFIQGKEALISISRDSFLINTVPIISEEINTQIDSSFLIIDDLKIKGKSKILLNGLPRFYTSFKLKDIPKSEYPNFIKETFERGSNKFSVDSIVSIKGLYNRDTILQIEFTHNTATYVKQIKDKLYINMNLSKELFNNYINAENRIYDEYIKYKSNDTYYYRLTIPKGYEVQYIPQSVEVNDNYLSCSILYNKTEDYIELTTNIRISDIIIPKSKFENWNKTIGILNKAYTSLVVLQKKN